MLIQDFVLTCSLFIFHFFFIFFEDTTNDSVFL